MKLIRYGNVGEEKPGLEFEGKWYDMSHLVREYDEDFFAAGGLDKLKGEFDPKLAKEVDQNTRLGAPVHRPGKIICIGLNYRKHAEESGMDVPKEPVVFFKATSSIVGPNDAIEIPKNSKKTDWEVELAVVIGKRANYISEEEAMDYVAGYCLHNDVSEREFQIERGGQWVKGKSCDTFAPLGPYLVTKDEIKDPNNLNLWLTVNGKKVQDGNTNDFIFNVQHVISYLSQFMSLMPGDVISTGTPEGVGFGFKPPVYLKGGDVVELGIEGLGSSRQEVKNYEG
ncbi:fumarylacetoacetate hydrolase family protein [Reichenbachiella carrageenanivorans]|uniref:Fumarylacetoacetate hydrolase family protein n=1 Tax=Reichenbachiella carrageenanivorans TaxID=2979869 RepID=A0ABY6D116_9BACT|nr:fumarylacetoacetate hydrolase family protein [Reichenbachiella carrageenanivorans]UXX79862.1 fumarylacetoacetate hydrolase family protein [Reichenbachiella carrageenanivorans]